MFGGIYNDYEHAFCFENTNTLVYFVYLFLILATFAKTYLRQCFKYIFSKVLCILCLNNIEMYLSNSAEYNIVYTCNRKVNTNSLHFYRPNYIKEL